MFDTLIYLSLSAIRKRLRCPPDLIDLAF